MAVNYIRCLDLYTLNKQHVLALEAHLCTSVEADLDGRHAHSSCAGVDEDLLALGYSAAHDHGVVGCHVGGRHCGSFGQAPAVRDDPGEVLAGDHLCGQRILGRTHHPGVGALLQSRKQL